MKNRFLLKKTSEAEDPGLLADKAVKNREDALPDEGTEALALQRHRAVLAKEPVDFAELEPARRKEASEAGPGTRAPRRVRTRASGPQVLVEVAAAANDVVDLDLFDKSTQKLRVFVETRDERRELETNEFVDCESVVESSARPFRDQLIHRSPTAF